MANSDNLGLSEISPSKSTEDEEDDFMTAAEVYEKLQIAWLNEKCAPNLLMYCGEIVDCINDQIQAMENNLENAAKSDFRVSIHRLELDRIRYVLISYLRCRLKKIERHCHYIMANADRFNTQSQEEQSEITNNGSQVKEYLSPQEKEFVKDYSENLLSYFTNTALKFMPINMQDIDKKLLSFTPNLDSHVFFRVNKNVNGVLIDDTSTSVESMSSTPSDEIIDFESGDQHLMRFRPIASLVDDSSVSLL